MAKKADISRVNVELGVRGFATLLWLKDTLEARTKIEVIRLALQVLYKLVKAVEDGDSVVIEHKDGRRTTKVFIPTWSAT